MKNNNGVVVQIEKKEFHDILKFLPFKIFIEYLLPFSHRKFPNITACESKEKSIKLAWGKKLGYIAERNHFILS